MQSYTLDQLQVKQYLRPDTNVLGLKGLNIMNRETKESNVEKVHADYYGAESKMYAFVPLVRLNYGFEIKRPLIKDFSIDCTGFVPILHMTITDGTGQLRGKYYPRCGSIVNIYIASLGPENYYKPIRADFLITDMRPSGADIQTDPDYFVQTPVEFFITGVLNIPRLFYKDNWFESGTSFNALKNLCSEIGIGFASNLEPTDFDDRQVWLCGHRSMQGFMEHICRHSYKDEESFMTCFIDLYYNLNFVEVSRLFSQMKENTECRIYPCVSSEDDEGELSEEELEKNRDDHPDYFTESEKVYDYQINNSKHLQSWSLFFKTYTPVADMHGMLYDGFKKEFSWYSLGDKEACKAIVVPFAPATEGLLPVNKGRLNEDGTAPEMLSKMKSFNYMGVLSEGQHKDFYVAEVQNTLNMSDIDMFGIDVDMQCVNMALTRFSRLRVILLTRNDTESSIITQTEGRGDGDVVATEKGDIELDKYPDLKSDSPADLTPEEKDAFGMSSNFDDADSSEKLNQALSGFYVITGYKILLSGNEPKLKSKVMLRRKEMYPPLRQDYEPTDKQAAP